MEVGVVIPVGPGRTENLLAVLGAIAQQTVKPNIVVVVCDGEEAALELEGAYPVPLAVARTEKHQPGLEQPRNFGVKLLEELVKPDMGLAPCTHVWFLDSDVLVEPDALEHYQGAMEAEPLERILIGPYDWMPPGHREPMHDLHNDPRWDFFNEHQPWDIIREQINAGLACFSGNLVWPIEEFKRVGGFWNELHHGRCEDGELGARAVAMGVPISLVPDARGWHMDHPRNMNWIREVNAIDVPKLNERHPWIEGEGLFVVEEDGKRFNVRCPDCSQEFGSGEIWAHKAACPGAAA